MTSNIDLAPDNLTLGIHRHRFRLIADGTYNIPNFQEDGGNLIS